MRLNTMKTQNETLYTFYKDFNELEKEAVAELVGERYSDSPKLANTDGSDIELELVLEDIKKDNTGYHYAIDYEWVSTDKEDGDEYEPVAWLWFATEEDVRERINLIAREQGEQILENIKVFGGMLDEFRELEEKWVKLKSNKLLQTILYIPIGMYLESRLLKGMASVNQRLVEHNQKLSIK